MKQLQTMFERPLAGIGGAGVIGIGLMVFAAAIYASAVVPAREELLQLQAKATRRASGNIAPADGVRTAAMRGSEQLAEFNRKVPSLADAPELVLKLHTIAGQNGIVLDSGEYKLLRERDSSIARYQITLPLRGTYWQVRLFIAQLLEELPSSALEEISIKRDSVSTRAVETRVRLTLYLGDGV